MKELVHHLPSDNPNVRLFSCIVCCNEAEYHVYAVYGNFYVCSADCYQRVMHSCRQLKNLRARTYAKSCSYSLTLKQWMYAQRYFHFRCAYCQKETSPLTVDHVIPLLYQGASSADNCVPSCYACNNKKGEFFGEALKYIFSEETYLAIDMFVRHQCAYLRS